MTGRVLLSFAFSLLLGGCALLPTAWNTPPAAPETLLREAESLREAGHWEAALARLRIGLRAYPGEPRFAVLSARWQREWADWRAVLKDRLRVVDAEALLKRRGLLERLELGERFDLLNRSRLAILNGRLRALREPLIACARRHVGDDVVLAASCVRLARRILPGADVEALMPAVVNRRKRPSATPRRDVPARSRRPRVAGAGNATRRAPAPDRIGRLLDEAAEALDSGALIDALAALDSAKSLDAENPRLARLRARFLAQVRPKVAALTAMGERLYREEQLQPALAIWRLAQGLAPDDPRLADRIRRAERVAAKLARLRAREQEKVETGAAAVSGEPPAGESAPAL